MVTRAQAITVLVTGAGAPGLPGTLYALHKNPDGLAVRIIGVDTECDVAGRFLADKFYLVPAPEDQSYVESMLEICRAESVAVVLPQTTREIAQLSHSREFFENEGIRVMVSTAPAIEAANNKWTLIKLSASLGVPCPAAHLTGSEEELMSAVCALGYPESPVVVKPPVSNGMRGV